MTPQQLDQQRADMMEALYQRSGRDDLPVGDARRKTYTGLWDEFCADIAANFRDTDYQELHAKVCMGMDQAESVFTPKQATAAIAVCRAELLGKWA